VCRRVHAGIYDQYKIRVVLDWFVTARDYREARQCLHRAMDELRLDSRPKAASASISSSTVFFSRDVVPPRHVLNGPELSSPDVSEIERKIERYWQLEQASSGSPPKPEQAKESAIPTRQKPCGPPLTMSAVPPSLRAIYPLPPRRELVVCKTRARLIVLDEIPVRELVALLTADGMTEATVVNAQWEEVGRVKLESLLLVLACDDGRSAVVTMMAPKRR
jgi:hypothetical protein